MASLEKDEGREGGKFAAGRGQQRSSQDDLVQRLESKVSGCRRIVLVRSPPTKSTPPPPPPQRDRCNPDSLNAILMGCPWESDGIGGLFLP